MLLIAFRHGDRRLFSRLVCLLRGGDTAHCEVADPSGGGMPLCVSASWVDGGVRGKHIDITDPGKWRVYLYQGPHEDLPVWLADHDHMGYDVLGLLGILFRPLRHALRRMFCSEAGADIVGFKEPELYDPRTFESAIGRMSLPAGFDGQQWAPLPATTE